MAVTDFTHEKETAFLLTLAKTGNVSKACLAAHISRPTAYNHKRDDAEFAAAWKEAEAVYTESLEAEADRRAVKGTLKPVFYQGQKCGSIREFSDTLLMFRLKKMDPEGYRENTKVEHAGGIKVQPVTMLEVVLPSEPEDAPSTSGEQKP